MTHLCQQMGLSDKILCCTAALQRGESGVQQLCRCVTFAALPRPIDHVLRIKTGTGTFIMWFKIPGPAVFRCMYCTVQYSAVVVVLVCTTAAQQQQPVLGWRLSLQLIAVVVTPSVQRESAQGCSCRREADQQSPARARKAAIRKLPPRVSREGKCLRRKKTFSSLKSTNTQVVDNQKLVELRNI